MAKEIIEKSRCPKCGQEVILTPKNSELVITHSHLYMSYWDIKCDRSTGGYMGGVKKKCVNYWSEFVSYDQDQAHEILRYFVSEGWALREELGPSDSDIAEYEGQAEIELRKYQDLGTDSTKAMVQAAWEFAQDFTVEDIVNALPFKSLKIPWRSL